eukprot:3293568-Heterocapsa_arctica.AAC.1
MPVAAAAPRSADPHGRRSQRPMAAIGGGRLAAWAAPAWGAGAVPPRRRLRAGSPCARGRSVVGRRGWLNLSLNSYG